MNSSNDGEMENCLPLSRNSFQSGTTSRPIHVACVIPSHSKKAPIVMLHGGFHTGGCFLSTPDLRPGWGQYFAARGHAVYLPDWPGHGSSPTLLDFVSVSSKDVADAIAVLIEQVGPAIVFSHSASGPIAWWLLANHRPKIVCVVGVAPGPPSNLSIPVTEVESEAVRFDGKPGAIEYSDPAEPVHASDQFIWRYWTNAANFPIDAIEAYRKGIVPESPQILNERFKKAESGLDVDIPKVGLETPVLVITGESDPRHPRDADEATANYLGADFIYLPDIGIKGNGHMMMIERNSDEVAGVIANWLSERKL